MYPKDNIFNIYNKIGKRLPFQVKRSVKGKGVTDTKYRYSQEGYTFMVERIEPKGEYGEAYGYCMVNGVRDDLCLKKYYPDNKGEIPNAGCGGWVLVTIPGVNMDEVFPTYNANDIVTFGRYKGKTFLEVYNENPEYISWLRDSSPYFKIDYLSLTGNTSEDENLTEILIGEFCKRPRITIDDIIPFGKYKGQTFKDVYKIDSKYINWMINNVDTIDYDISSFADMMLNVE